jgi:hypothetical protein
VSKAHCLAAKPILGEASTADTVLHHDLCV